jgi:allantoate deiminase
MTAISNIPATARMMARIEELATITDEPGKLTRLYLSPAHRRAIDKVVEWFAEAGLNPEVNAVGTITGRMEGHTPGLPALVIGSHIDSVADAGKYDGPLGVLSGLAVIEEIRRLGEELPFAIEVHAFGDEEGVRFPATLSGSRAVAGKFEPEALDGADRDGITMREALKNFGYDPDAIPAITRKPGELLAYIETHIEQGPVLETANQPLGVVTSIASIRRLDARVTGEAGHAGTVPMAYRQDALTAAAEMVLAIERVSRQRPGMVGTVGRIEALPGAINVIPGEVRFTLDMRAPEDAARRAGVTQILAEITEIAERRKVKLDLTAGYEENAAPCHPAIRAGLSAAISALGYEPIAIPSGAGHDAMSFDGVCPMGMIFVRCKGGISHNPGESITEADADVALRAMLAFIRALDPAKLREA